MALLTLGGVLFDSFEVPASIRFGGTQRTVIHRLLGGARVIDTMGRDDSALEWSGIFSGPTASDRARVLDAMRVAGNVLTLAWDAFCYDVIIGSLQLDFRNPWWVPFRISCTVVSDLASFAGSVAESIGSTVLSDLAAAAPFTQINGVIEALSMPDALVTGATAIAPAIVALTTAQSDLRSTVGALEQGLDATDVLALVSTSGSLAQLCAAQGFLQRSLANLEEITI